MLEGDRGAAAIATRVLPNVLLAWALLGLGPGCATAYIRPAPPDLPPPAPVAADTVPAGTLITAQLNQPLSSDHNRPGDRFTAETLDPIVNAGGDEVVPRGAQIDGVVQGSQRSAYVGEHPGLNLQVVGLESEGGPPSRVPIEVAQSPVEMSSATAREIVGALGGAGVGAAIGVGFDRQSAGVVVGTTFLGLGLGALLGYLFSPRDAILPVGSVVTLRVTRDIRFEKPVASREPSSTGATAHWRPVESPVQVQTLSKPAQVQTPTKPAEVPILRAPPPPLIKPVDAPAPRAP